MASDNGEWSYADTDEEILTRIAWYYYNDGLTQNEIGEKLNMSRIKVSRLLESGRRSGIIQVRINSRYQGCLALERQIKERYGLLEAYVVPQLPDQDPSDRLGQAAAQFLMQRLQPDDLLAVGWGATVSNTIQRLGHLANERNIGLVSLTGGVGTYVNGMRRANGAAAFISYRRRSSCATRMSRATSHPNPPSPTCSKWRSTRVTSSLVSANFRPSPLSCVPAMSAPTRWSRCGARAPSATSSANSTTNAASHSSCRCTIE
jgi:transcriptional regulator with XRE-family HTH domain